MTANEKIVERRKVDSFDRVVLRVYNVVNQVQIKQADHQSLTIEARPDIASKITTTVRGGALVIRYEGSWLDKLGFALATSLTRPTVRYHVTVTELACLDLAGFVRAHAAELRANRLSLKLKGVGEIIVGSLAARSLAADLDGPGRIELAGHVQEQQVTIQGPGLYEARELQSRRARVALKGLGRAAIWATDNLDIRVRGLGRVEVRGTPLIKEDISPRAPLPRFGQP